MGNNEEPFCLNKEGKRNAEGDCGSGLRRKREGERTNTIKRRNDREEDTKMSDRKESGSKRGKVGN